MTTKNQFLHELLLVSFKKLKLRLTILFMALIFLALSQGLLVALLEPFMKVIFSLDSQGSEISLQKLLPAHIYPYVANVDLKVQKEWVLIGLPLGLLLSGFIRSISTYSYQIQLNAISLQVADEYRCQLFSKVVSSSYTNFMTKSPAQWMSLIMNDVLYLQLRFSDFVGSFIKDGIVMISAIITLLFIQPSAAFLILFLSPFIAFGMGRTGKRIGSFAASYQNQLALMADSVLDFRQRFSFIRAHRAEAFELLRFRRINEFYYKTVKRSLFVRSVFAPAMEFFGFLLFATIIYAAVHFNLSQELSPNRIIVFFAAVGVMLRPLRNIGEQIAKYSETKGALAASLDVMTKIEGSFLTLSKKKAPNLLRQLKIKHLEVAYEAGKKALLAANLEFLPRKSIAVVGPSGAGKSSLIRSLAGLIKPVQFDASLSWEEALDQCFFVSQKPFMFAGSLKENLCYGLPEATDEKIWQALAKVDLASYVKALPAGLDENLVGLENSFSGGQLQRLVLSRGLISEKPIKLFDEVTSALDPVLEAQVVKMLIEDCQKQGYSLVFVTHRLDHLANFDEIWFVEGGKLVYQGPNHELLNHSRYREFLELSKH